MSETLSGLRAWLLQRLSAVYMALYLVFLPLMVAIVGPQGYSGWHDLFARPVVSVTSAIFAIALLLHIWVGVRDVCLDYLHHPWVRLGVLSLLGTWLLAMGFWVARILINVSV